MPPKTLENVQAILGINAEKSFHLNLGNDRQNIVPLVWPMEGGASNLAALDFIVCGRDQPLRTIVYFNSKRLAMRACNYLQRKLPYSRVCTVDVLHASRGPRSKREVMEQFCSGKVLVLCATEVVGMGTDIPDVDDVVQFMTPQALSVWTQRAGRDAKKLVKKTPKGRENSKDDASDHEKGDQQEPEISDGSFNGASEPGGSDSDSGPQDTPMDGWEEFNKDAVYQKKHVDPEMREWILAEGCRRIISDTYFDNPACSRAPLSNLCCDNCIRKNGRMRHIGSIYGLIGLLDASHGREPISRPWPTDSDDSDLESAVSPKTWGNLCAGNYLTVRHRVLEVWRYDCWKQNYQLCSWGVTGVMPDQVLSKLASFIKIEAIDDLLEAVSDWGYGSKYGPDILSLLKDTDCKHLLESQAQRTKTRQANKKRKLEDLERNEALQNLRGFRHSGSLALSLALAHTWMLDSVLIKHILCPVGSQPSRPPPSQPQPSRLQLSHPQLPCLQHSRPQSSRTQPSRLQSQPIFISCPYIRTDITDSLMNNSWHT
ncbi:hypothetical protein BJ322DRAFT_1109140 [Thelephora terrestris]|uniref:DNA 3'-5' helicase n=1 Tax=Thelephora terrestris TaxID=56493 RepID=A0A9P6HFQ3_9AGAM|nr:hypothetical protein BJ322DRAFT_1109140 [Thelephora terrestris]